MTQSKKPQQAAVIIKGAETITLDDEGRVGRLQIRIQGNRIDEVAPNIKPRKGDQVIDAKGLVAMPGFVQAHMHLCQTLCRGQAEDLPLLDWLRSKIWPYEGSLTAADMRTSARLGIAELLLGGTTCILDMGSVQHTGELFKAAKTMGIRYTGGKALMDQGQGYPAGLRETTEEAVEESIRLCQKWHDTQKGRLRYAFSPRFALSSSPEAMGACVHEARKAKALLHTHAAENSEEVQLIRARTGMGNVAYLHDLGFSGPDVVLAHCLWLSLDERRIMRETQTRIVHCPSANLKLASGVARISEYINEGIHVALGTDGAACNNRLDAFNEMRLAALLQKIKGGAAALSAAAALALATRKGAQALGFNHLGAIAKGFGADIILLNITKPHSYPPTDDLISRVVYSAQPSDVHTVIVDGKIVVQQGVLLSANTNTILAGAKRASAAIQKRLA